MLPRTASTSPRDLIRRRQCPVVMSGRRTVARPWQDATEEKHMRRVARLFMFLAVPALVLTVAGTALAQDYNVGNQSSSTAPAMPARTSATFGTSSLPVRSSARSTDHSSSLPGQGIRERGCTALPDRVPCRPFIIPLVAMASRHRMFTVPWSSWRAAPSPQWFVPPTPSLARQEIARAFAMTTRRDWWSRGTVCREC